jgi:DNA repair protein RadC
MTQTIQSELSPEYISPVKQDIPSNAYDIFTYKEYATIVKAHGIIRQKYLRESEVLSSPELTRKFLSLHLAHEQFEVFGVLWLDNRHKVLETVNLFNGTVDGAAVYPRVVATSALRHRASACIFFHNHPSGNPEPSQADITLTTRLKSTLALLDIRVLDHIVVGGVDTISLAERGLL